MCFCDHVCCSQQFLSETKSWIKELTWNFFWTWEVCNRGNLKTSFCLRWWGNVLYTMYGLSLRVEEHPWKTMSYLEYLPWSPPSEMWYYALNIGLSEPGTQSRVPMRCFEVFKNIRKKWRVWAVLRIIFITTTL